MTINIDEFSAKPLYLEIFKSMQNVGIATGFCVRKDTSCHLVTNWHVVSGRDPNTGFPLSPSSADPDMMRVWFHGQQPGRWMAKDIAIVDSAGRRQWREHGTGSNVDVVALPLPSFADIKIYDLDLSLADFDLMIYPSEAVSIIGFPEGLTSGGKFPIWKTGHIASDTDIDWNGKPAFLIDATTKSGMSGSPVIAKRVSIYQTSRGNKTGNAVRFLGVYSGREVGRSGIEVGLVWKPSAISEILAA